MVFLLCICKESQVTKVKRKRTRWYALVPAHARKIMDGWVNSSLSLFLFQEGCQFFLYGLLEVNQTGGDSYANLSGFVKFFGHGCMTVDNMEVYYIILLVSPFWTNTGRISPPTGFRGTTCIRPTDGFSFFGVHDMYYEFVSCIQCTMAFWQSWQLTDEN